MIRSRLIDPRIRMNLYKTYIRPILAYAAAIWVRPINLSSHQMERIRQFERGIIRTAAGVRRAIGSYVYARNGDLYERAGCLRIDRFLVQRAINFFDSCSKSTIEKLSCLSRPGPGGFFTELSNLWQSDLGDQLYDDGRLLIFNRAYDGSGRAVYGSGQWWSNTRFIYWRLCRIVLFFEIPLYWIAFHFFLFFMFYVRSLVVISWFDVEHFGS